MSRTQLILSPEDGEAALSLSPDVLIVLKPPDQTSFALNRRSRSYVSLRHVEALLIQELCSSTSVEKVSRLLLTRIPKFTAKLIEAEIIINTAPDSRLAVNNIFSMASTVERFFVELTSACDLRCQHCFGMFGPSMRTDIPVDVVVSLLEEGRKLGVHRIDLTGGEPTMYPNFSEVINAVAKTGLVYTLFSNLTHLSTENFSALVAYQPLHVTTSVESHDSKIHDAFRGQSGSLRRTMENIRKLRDHGVPVQVNLVVGSHNYSSIQDTLSWLKSENIPVVVDTVRLEGRATKEMLLSAAQAQNLMRILNSHGSIPVDPQPGTCGVANSMVYISSKGKLKLCPSLGDTYELADLLNTENLGVLLRKSISSLPVRYQEFTHRPCRSSCAASSRCDGGCPAQALLSTGSALSPDPHMCVRFEDAAFLPRDSKLVPLHISAWTT